MDKAEGPIVKAHDYVILTAVVFVGVLGALAVAGVFVKQQVEGSLPTGGGVLGTIAGLFSKKS